MELINNGISYLILLSLYKLSSATRKAIPFCHLTHTNWLPALVEQNYSTEPLVSTKAFHSVIGGMSYTGGNMVLLNVDAFQSDFSVPLFISSMRPGHRPSEHLYVMKNVLLHYTSNKKG